MQARASGRPSGPRAVAAVTKQARRHARKYLASTRKAQVLQRYAGARSTQSRPQFLRHLCHACAWVALLPAEVAAGAGDEALSPVRVLTIMLRQRGRGALTSRLRNSLDRVRGRVAGVLAASAHSDARPAWEELWRALPQSRTNSEPQASMEHHAEIAAGPGAVTAGGATAAESWPSAAGESRTMTLHAVREEQRRVLIRAGSHAASRHAEIAAVLWRGQDALTRADPEAMVRAVVECVGFLSAPRQKATIHTGKAMTEEATLQLQAATQTRLRHLLLRLLGASGGGGLDLGDPGTCTLLLRPLERLRHLLRDQKVSKLASSRQWSALAGMLDEAQHKRCDEDVGGHTQANGIGPGLVGCDGKVWQPYPRVRGFSTVQHRPAEATVLRCTQCAVEIVSAWYFVNPSSGKSFVLTPHNGHSRCGGAPFKAADGSPVARDATYAIDFCKHRMKRCRCAECGGEELCAHGKQSYQCKVCVPRSKRRRLMS